MEARQAPRVMPVTGKFGATPQTCLRSRLPIRPLPKPVTRTFKPAKCALTLATVEPKTNLRFATGSGVALGEIIELKESFADAQYKEAWAELYQLVFKYKSKKGQERKQLAKFSGLVYINAEVERPRMIARADKLTTKVLHEMFDMLNLSRSSRVFASKRQLVERLVEFLESPDPSVMEKKSAMEKKASLAEQKATAKRKRDETDDLVDKLLRAVVKRQIEKDGSDNVDVKSLQMSTEEFVGVKLPTKKFKVAVDACLDRVAPVAEPDDNDEKGDDDDTSSLDDNIPGDAPSGTDDTPNEVRDRDGDAFTDALADALFSDAFPVENVTENAPTQGAHAADNDELAGQAAAAVPTSSAPVSNNEQIVREATTDAVSGSPPVMDESKPIGKTTCDTSANGALVKDVHKVVEKPRRLTLRVSPVSND